MPRRISEPARAVTLTLDGEAIRAAEGEPIAAALVASGRLVLARSPKLHRPRSPTCLRGACDGCLARVDGVPNVMTCMVAAREGAAVASQNSLGSRDVDLLRVTDWFFPDGMNHHELFAGVPGVQSVMQAFARRVAGLGRLPSERAEPRPAARREADAVIVGAGPFGMAAALALAAKGRAVEVLDDSLAYGGAIRALHGAAREPWRPLLDAFAAASKGAGRGAIRLRLGAAAAGLYGDDLLVAAPDGAEIVTARDVVFAPGAHDGVLAFAGNDLPGIVSARAAGLLLASGVLVGERIVVAIADGGGPFGEAYAQEVARVAPEAEVTIVRAPLVAAEGSSRVKKVVVERGAPNTKSAKPAKDAGAKPRATEGEAKPAPVKTASIACDALVVDAPRSPAYELCEQAGAELAAEPAGFRVVTRSGAIRRGIWAIGEVAGDPLDPARARAAAEWVTAGS